MFCILKYLFTEFLSNMSQNRSTFVTIELRMTFHYASKHHNDFVRGLETPSPVLAPEAIYKPKRPSVTPKATPDPLRPLVLCCFSPTWLCTAPVATSKIEP
jgi:hypothetical protein